MTNYPKVYVIIPIYNVEFYLRECLDSVVNQTYKNLRIILVNDGSTDSSEAIAREYLSDQRVSLISKENGGLSSARNAGLREAYLDGNDGDYILFLDSDDYLALSYVDSMVKAIVANPQAEIALGSVRGICNDRVVFREIERDVSKNYAGLEYLTSIPNHYFTFAWGGGIRMNFLRNNQIFFVEGIINEDLIFGFMCFLDIKKVCFFNDIVFYRIREGSISHPKTFNQHKVDLLFKSYLTNFKYLLPLYSQEKYRMIKTLLKNCLIANAQIPVLCWIKDKSLCEKEELQPLVPFMKTKTKIAYYFPIIARVAMRFKKWIKNG